MNDTPSDTAGVVAPPPLVYAGGLLLGLLLQRLRPVPVLPPRLSRIIGFALIALNFLFGPPAVIAMRRGNTALNPMTPTTAIITSGPFRYTRNPIYLSFTILYAGIALARNALWPLLLLPGVLAIMNRGVIDREEKYLERKFGNEYRRYKNTVRRWM